MSTPATHGNDGHYTGAISAVTWTLSITWSGNTFSGTRSLTFAVGYALSGSEGTFNPLGTGSVSFSGSSGTNTGTATGSAASPSVWYHIVLQITMPSQSGTLTTTSSSYLNYPATLVPENLLPLFILVPVIPLVMSRRKRKIGASQ